MSKQSTPLPDPLNFNPHVKIVIFHGKRTKPNLWGHPLVTHMIDKNAHDCEARRFVYALIEYDDL